MLCVTIYFHAYHIWTDPTFLIRTPDVTMTSLWHHPYYDLTLTSL